MFRPCIALVGVGVPLVLLVACAESPEPAADPAPAPPASPPATQPTAASPSPGSPEADALARAEAAAKQLTATLKPRVAEEIAKGGPAAAVNVCAGEAQALTARVQAETGVTVGRSSLRLRNPANVAPPWVAEWLTAQGERAATGVTPIAEVVDGTARVLKPIPIEEKCLLCHGPTESLAPEVKALLAEKYPNDAATGYALGDLRGALWATVPVGG